jgi:hypothetical protein
MEYRIVYDRSPWKAAQAANELAHDGWEAINLATSSHEAYLTEYAVLMRRPLSQSKDGKPNG